MGLDSVSWSFADEPDHIRLLRDSLRQFVAREMPEEKVRDVMHANTGREVRGIIRENVHADKIFDGIVKRAISSARTFAGPSPNITYYLFDFDGELLATQRDEGINETPKQTTLGV